MSGHIIEAVSKEKDLGVLIDEQLKFHDHTSYVTSKANRTIGIIKKAFINVNTDTFLSLYKAIICPQLEYANVIWGSSANHVWLTSHSRNTLIKDNTLMAYIAMAIGSP